MIDRGCLSCAGGDGSAAERKLTYEELLRENETLVKENERLRTKVSRHRAQRSGCLGRRAAF